MSGSGAVPLCMGRVRTSQSALQNDNSKYCHSERSEEPALNQTKGRFLGLRPRNHRQACIGPDYNPPPQRYCQAMPTMSKSVPVRTDLPRLPWSLVE